MISYCNHRQKLEEWKRKQYDSIICCQQEIILDSITHIYVELKVRIIEYN